MFVGIVQRNSEFPLHTGPLVETSGVTFGVMVTVNVGGIRARTGLQGVNE
jgi:hypothetical protein